MKRLNDILEGLWMVTVLVALPSGVIGGAMVILAWTLTGDAPRDAALLTFGLTLLSGLLLAARAPAITERAHPTTPRPIRRRGWEHTSPPSRLTRRKS